MADLAVLAGMFFGGWAGWWIGSKFNVAWALLFCSVGTVAGAFIGWGVAQKYF